MRSRTTPPRKDLTLKIKLRTKMRKNLQRMKISFQKIKLTMIAVMVAMMTRRAMSRSKTIRRVMKLRMTTIQRTTVIKTMTTRPRKWKRMKLMKTRMAMLRIMTPSLHIRKLLHSNLSPYRSMLPLKTDTHKEKL